MDTTTLTRCFLAQQMALARSIRASQPLAVDRSPPRLGELRYDLQPTDKTLVKAFGIQAGKHPPERIVRGGDIIG